MLTRTLSLLAGISASIALTSTVGCRSKTTNNFSAQDAPTKALPNVDPEARTNTPAPISMGGEAAGRRVDGLAAVVDGRVVTWSEVEQMVQAQEKAARVYFAGHPTQLQEVLGELRKNALGALIERELIQAEFAKLGGQLKESHMDEIIDEFVDTKFDGNRTKFLEALKKEGMTLSNFRDARSTIEVRRFMEAQQTRKIPPPTPTEIQAEYEANPDDYRERGSVKLRTITIPRIAAGSTIENQRNLADDLRSKAVSGADFGTLARTYSSDSRAPNGGDLGWVTPSEIPAGLAQLAYSVEPGTITEVLEDGRTFFIIWVEGHRDGKLTPLSEVHNKVEQRVSSSNRKEVVDRWIERLRRNAVIQTFE